MSLVPKGSQEEKQLLIRIPKNIHHELRRISFENEISMKEICVQALEQFLKKNKKNIKSD